MTSRTVPAPEPAPTRKAVYHGHPGVPAEPAEAEPSAPAPTWAFVDKLREALSEIENESSCRKAYGLAVRALQLRPDAPRTPETAEPAPTRDESVLPPGFDETPGWVYRKEESAELTIADAWRIYDAEHGYAPDLAAAQETIRRLTVERDAARLAGNEYRAAWKRSGGRFADRDLDDLFYVLLNFGKQQA